MNFKYFHSERQRDIRALVIRANKLYGANIAYREITRDRQVVDYTFAKLEQDRISLGTKLMQMGFKGSHIMLLSESLYAWVLGYVTTVCGLGVVVPMDKELPPADIAKLLRKSDTDVVICSQTFVPTMNQVREQCPGLKACIVMNPTQENEGFLNLSDLISDGRALVEAGDTGYRDCELNPDAMCEILFTSGTTGANKGVMLSNKNIMAVLFGSMQLISAGPVNMSVLPINHSYECTCDILGGLYMGATLCFNDSLKHLMDNLMLFKPTFALMVPLFLETMYKRLWKEAEKQGLAHHLHYGITYSNLLRKIGIDLRPLFFKPVLDKFGGNLKQIVCGGAPLRTELIKGFDDIGINVVNGYGITECAPVISSNCTKWKRLDSVGQVLSVCDVRIADPDSEGNGEVQVKGDTVMLGYYKDEEATYASFTPDGYFKTGDLGHLDRQNFLYLSGRKKNLIILPNGKNVCPEELEDALAGSIPYIKECMVFSFATRNSTEESIQAEVFLDEEYVAAVGEANARAQLEEDLRKLNSRLPMYKRIQTIELRFEEFEKTTTKKIKRQAVIEGKMRLA